MNASLFLDENAHQSTLEDIPRWYAEYQMHHRHFHLIMTLPQHPENEEYVKVLYEMYLREMQDVILERMRNAMDEQFADCVQGT